MTPETYEKFAVWCFDKHLKYGDWFEDWWKKEGQEIFFAYARARGQEFIERLLSESMNPRYVRIINERYWELF
jgi:hypothetical protein